MMMVSEVPKMLSPGTVLPLPTPEKGEATSFALLLSQSNLRQGSDAHDADGSDEQLSSPRQRRRGAVRDAGPNGSEPTSSDGAKLVLSVPGQAVTTTSVIASPNLDLPVTIAQAPVSLVDQPRMDAVGGKLTAGMQTPVTPQAHSQAPSVAIEDDVSGENLPHDTRQIPPPSMSLDGNATLKLEFKGISSIDLSDSATHVNGRPSADASQEHRAGINESGVSAPVVGSDLTLPNPPAPIDGPLPKDVGASPELAQVTIAPNGASSMIAQQPPAGPHQGPSISTMERTSKVTPNAKGAILPPSSSPSDQSSDKEEVMSAVEAVGGAAAGNTSPGHQGLPHGPDAPSAPEHRPARGDNGLQNTAQPMDPAQPGAGRSVSVESAPVGGNSLSSTSTSTQAAFQRVADFSASRELQNALRSDLHVGVPTEAFGHVTIQTTSASGQISAQVSLEDARQGAVLAGHLPVVEQRLMQHLGLDASVRLTSGSSGAGGAWSGPGGGGAGRDAAQEDRRSSGSGRQMSAVRSLSGTSGHKEESPTSSMCGSPISSSRLDLRV